MIIKEKVFIKPTVYTFTFTYQGMLTIHHYHYGHQKCTHAQTWKNLMRGKLFYSKYAVYIFN